MKKLIALLLALMMCLPALAEEIAPPAAEDAPLTLLAPFEMTLPTDVTVQENAGGTSVTFAHGNGATRVVGMVLSRVPDVNGDHAAELERLMNQFAPGSQEHTPLALAEGFHGLLALTPAALEGAGGTAIDQVTVMILWQTEMRGELLILSGYDMAGQTARAWTLIDALLQSATVEGVQVVPAENATDAQ
ncbi:MAG: hypothetical protein IJE07_13790 [Clostridia bacterium]|nr:hypothetical protein [Clostridia bacterium]